MAATRTVYYMLIKRAARIRPVTHERQLLPLFSVALTVPFSALLGLPSINALLGTRGHYQLYFWCVQYVSDVLLRRPQQPQPWCVNPPPLLCSLNRGAQNRLRRLRA